MEEVQTALVADDKEAIQQQLRKWSDDDGSALDVVFTTGGTGFGVSKQLLVLWLSLGPPSCNYSVL